jgi:hypothetical protein
VWVIGFRLDWDDSIFYGQSYGATRTLLSDDSKSLAMSCSEGKPPAVTSEANVKVQYVSILFVSAAMVNSDSAMVNQGGENTAAKAQTRPRRER